MLLRSGHSRYVLSGAAEANGLKLDPGKRYRHLGRQGEVIRETTGQVARHAPPPMRSAPSGGVRRSPGRPTTGRAAAATAARWSSARGVGGLLAVNALGLEQYVAGVISAEVPARWPVEALRAQAVGGAHATRSRPAPEAARASPPYADTRSQMYRGVSAETPATDAAVRATSGLVVTYDGKPVTTYFFSTSGGRTENVENVFIGGQPRPWLKSVEDPYDDVSPSHRWGPFKFSIASATAKLRAWCRGACAGSGCSSGESRRASCARSSSAAPGRAP